MVERTLADEIISIVHSEANNNPLPVKCTIHEIHPNGLIDVILENGNIVTYLSVIGSARVGDTGVLVYLDDETNNQIIITNGGAVGGGGSTGTGGEVDLSNYIQKSSTSGLVKNDGSIDTTSYLSSLPIHTHMKSEITDFTHTHSTATLETDGFLSKQDKAKLDNLSYDSGWQEVTFKTGYARYNDSMSVYIRRKGNCVELTGMWKTTSKKTAPSKPVPFASIPDELKPTKSINVICPGAGKNTYRLTVDANGELKWSQYGVTNSIDLSESSFCHVRCTWTI